MERSASSPTLVRGRVTLVALLVALVAVAFVPRSAISQELSVADGEEFFFWLLEQEGDVDLARQGMIDVGLSEHQAAVTAAFWCADPPGEGCSPDSHVVTVWNRFLAHLNETGDADLAYLNVAEETGGDVLAAAIAAYWCSPEPGAGCDNTYLLAFWDVYLAGQDGRDFETVAEWDWELANAMLAWDLLGGCGEACDPNAQAPPPAPAERPAERPTTSGPQREPRLLKAGMPKTSAPLPCQRGRHPRFPNCE